jgi:hypothetical protein
MVASKKMWPIMRCWDIPHQTPIFSEWRGSSCIALGFSLAKIREFCELTYPDRWNHASSENQQRGASGRKQAGWRTTALSQQLGALQTHTTDTFLFISHTTNVLLFKFHCNIFIGVRIIKEMPDSVASGTHCSLVYDMQSGRWLPCSGRKYIFTSGLKVEIIASLEKLAMTCHVT